ncbi:hypothetical protein JCM30471_35030 [Desulfuromonas carbonis]
MLHQPHKWLLLKLFLVWLLLSLVIGGLVRYLGNVQLDNHVVSQARSETDNYALAVATYLEAPSPEALTLLDRKIRTSIEQDNLIVVEFYDSDARKFTEAIKPSAQAIEEQLPKHGTGFAGREGTLCEKMTLGPETYLRVFVPIHRKDGRRIGYLEGIYRAPAEMVARSKQQIFWSLLLVVLVIFTTSLVLYPLILRLNRKLIDYSQQLALTNVGLLKVLGNAVAKRDSDTNIHNYRVTLYSVRIGELLGLPSAAMQGLIKGAFLHDLGKIAISDNILHKAGRLTAAEIEIMKSHVDHGEDILRSYDWLRDGIEVTRCHHEKFDGSGYPQALKGAAIPLNARIFAIADVFDALTSKRPYKEPFSFETAVAILHESSGSHFDPAVSQLFLDHAAALYAEIGNDDEVFLQAKLESCIATYFH